MYAHIVPLFWRRKKFPCFFSEASSSLASKPHVLFKAFSYTCTINFFLLNNHFQQQLNMPGNTHLRKILPWPHVPPSLSIHSFNFSCTFLVPFLLPHHNKAFWKICVCSLSLFPYFSFCLHLGFCSYHNSEIASFWTTDLQIAKSNNPMAHFIWNYFPFLQLFKTFVYMAACFSNFLRT